jgi:hypothetical protein
MAVTSTDGWTLGAVLAVAAGVAAAGLRYVLDPALATWRVSTFIAVTDEASKASPSVKRGGRKQQIRGAELLGDEDM